MPAPSTEELKALRAAALATSAAAAAAAAGGAQAGWEAEWAGRGARIAAEQDALFEGVWAGAEGAVMEAARQGRSNCVLLEFDGAAKAEGAEFCTLYLLKGPAAPVGREEMRAMGVAPLLRRFDAALQGSGMAARLEWDKATNRNTLRLSWA